MPDRPRKERKENPSGLVPHCQRIVVESFVFGKELGALLEQRRERWKAAQGTRQQTLKLCRLIRRYSASPYRVRCPWFPPRALRQRILPHVHLLQAKQRFLRMELFFSTVPRISMAPGSIFPIGPPRIKLLPRNSTIGPPMSFSRSSMMRMPLVFRKDFWRWGFKSSRDLTTST